MAQDKICIGCEKVMRNVPSNKVYCNDACRKEYDKQIRNEIADKIKDTGIQLDESAQVIEEQDNIQKGATGRVFNFKYVDGVANARVDFGKGPTGKKVREWVPVHALAPVTKEDQMPGGLADDETIETISAKHGVSIEKIKRELAKGVTVELEHTNDADKAKEIALDHLTERPDYYERLEEMEKLPIQVSEEVELPNSADEFDEAIMEQIEPHDDWVGNVIKEREVKKQISELIQGGDPDEREAAIEKIFEKYKSRSSSADLSEDYSFMPSDIGIRGINDEPSTYLETFKTVIGDDLLEEFMQIENRTSNKRPVAQYYILKSMEDRGGMAGLIGPNRIKAAYPPAAELKADYLKILEENQREKEFTQPPVAQTDTPDQSELETLETSQIDITATPEKKKDYYEINQQIEKMLQEKGDGPYSPEEKAFLAKFSGYGGLHEYMPLEERKDTKILYEFFTPVKIVQTMWGLAYKYGYKGGPVLEPSAGTGAFIQFAPRDAQITAYELNPISAKILKILYPNVNVINSKFENAFIENRKSVGSKVEPKYDLVIGNPPFGKFSGMEAAFEKKHTKAANYIDYFITRSLDLLKPGGLLVFIVGTSVESGGVPFLERDFVKAKKDIRDKSALLDAYRLPNGVFDRTNVLTDIIVLQKK